MFERLFKKLALDAKRQKEFLDNYKTIVFIDAVRNILDDLETQEEEQLSKGAQIICDILYDAVDFIEFDEAGHEANVDPYTLTVSFYKSEDSSEKTTQILDDYIEDYIHNSEYTEKQINGAIRFLRNALPERVKSIEDDDKKLEERLLNASSSIDSNAIFDLFFQAREMRGEMNNLESRRAFFVDAMEATKTKTREPAIKALIDDIVRDRKKHFVAVSENGLDSISYAKSEDVRYNDEKRTMTTLSKYMKRHYKDKLNMFNITDDMLNAIEDVYLVEVDRIHEEYLNQENDVEDYMENLTKAEEEANPKEAVKTSNTRKDSANEVNKTKLKLVFDRIKLINALKQPLKHTLFSASDYENLSKVINQIDLDNNLHFLSLSQEDNGKVSYAKNEEDRFDNEKRTKTTLEKYLKKHFKAQLANVNSVVIADFCKNVARVIENPKLFSDDNEFDFRVNSNTSKNTAKITDFTEKEMEGFTENLKKAVEKVKKDLYVKAIQNELKNSDVNFEENNQKEVNNKQQRELFNDLLTNFQKQMDSKKLAKDRELLLKAIDSVINDLSNNNKIYVNLPQSYKDDLLNYCADVKDFLENEDIYVSLSQETPGMISYAKHIEDKFNNDTRTKTTLSKLINRNLGYSIPLFEHLVLRKLGHQPSDEISKYYSFNRNSGALEEFQKLWEKVVNPNRTLRYMFSQANYSQTERNGSMIRFYHGVSGNSSTVILYDKDGNATDQKHFTKAQDGIWKLTSHQKVIDGTFVEQIKQADPIKPAQSPAVIKPWKKEMTNAGYRVAANQITKGIKTAIVTLMEKKGMDQGGLKHVKDVLDSEMGLAIISTMMGYSLTYSKLNSDTRVAHIAKEFRTEGMATAGNAIIDEAMSYILPAIVDALKEGEKEKFRVEAHNQEKVEDEIELIEDEQNMGQEISS